MAEHSSKRQWSLEALPPMDDQQFDRWQALLEQRTGMTLPENRKSFLQTNLVIRMREVGCTSYQDYYDQVVDAHSGIMEWTTLVDRLTVQETRFYRDEDACNLVRDYLLTRPLEQIKRTNIEAWSVGCATGEEPYTLAMIIAQCLESLELKQYFGVTGTDISTPALDKARAGVYPSRKLITLNDQLRDKYFDQEPGGQWRVSDQLKDRVCFARVNVMDLSKAPIHGMNIIFCQNLLIYFKRFRRKEILNRLAERLLPGGMLILGLGEVTDWSHPQLQRMQRDNVLAFVRHCEHTDSGA